MALATAAKQREQPRSMPGSAKSDRPGRTGGKTDRLTSLDAFRGLLLLAVISGGFGLTRLAGDADWGWLAAQWRPRAWAGCALRDLVGPAFLLAAGAALPFAYAKRQAQGWPRQLVHAVLRAAVLVFLGVYLDSYRENRLVLHPRGELQTIGLACLLAFLVVPLGARARALAAAFLLVGHTAAYVIFGGATGESPWQAGDNVGLFLDRWLGLAPHPEQYVALNLLSATAIVLAGATAGELLRGGLSPARKAAALAALGAGGVLLGWLLAGGGGWAPVSWTPVVPVLPRLGSASFALLAAGWGLLLLAVMYAVVDGVQWRAVGGPLAVAGRNGLALTLAFMLFHDWAARTAGLALAAAPAGWVASRPLLADLLVMLIFWLLALWLSRRQIYMTV